VFTARYALSPYIKQIRFVFKGLIRFLLFGVDFLVSGDFKTNANVNTNLLRHNWATGWLGTAIKADHHMHANIGSEVAKAQEFRFTEVSYCRRTKLLSHIPVVSRNTWCVRGCWEGRRPNYLHRKAG
jgi:hypothetical protein